MDRWKKPKEMLTVAALIFGLAGSAYGLALLPYRVNQQEERIRELTRDNRELRDMVAEIRADVKVIRMMQEKPKP